MEESNSSKFDQLCDNLDELTLKQVDYLDETLSLMSKLENHLTSGFIDLAKSRYINGERTVSTMQIPGEESDVEPTTTVIRDKENKLVISRNKEANDPLKWFDLFIFYFLINILILSIILRFGVLVPSSLRQSQKSFHQVLETAVEILNARKEWLTALEEAKTLSAEKNSS